MGSGRAGFVRAVLLGLVYALLMWRVLEWELWQRPSSFPLGEQWGLVFDWALLLVPALVYGLLVASWWALIVPGAVFIFALTRLGGPNILVDLNVSELVLLLAVGPTIAICAGVALRTLPIREWGKKQRELG